MFKLNKKRDLTTGSITGGLWSFAIPLMLGNVFQQFYNLADTWVVGRYVGDNALAAVGSSYTLLTFLTSVITGLSLGTGAYVSMEFGRRRDDEIRSGVYMSSVMIGALALGIMLLFYMLVDPIIALLCVPTEIAGDMKTYLLWVFIGFFATFLYNYISNLLRAVGNSVVPLVFLSLSVVLNVALDLYFVISLEMGITGAAAATVISQYVSGIGLLLYFIFACPEYRVKKEDMHFEHEKFKKILSLSGFTCLQQSVMNFGILVVQGIVNSFGAVVMAAFAVAVKIDTIAYMPLQDFGNAFSVFVAQNFGAQKTERIRSGIRQAALSVAIFSMAVSAIVFCFASPLMSIFVDSANQNTIAEGVRYLQIEGACYIGIGVLFMLYGYYRAVNMPLMSVVLTVVSLGTRVLLAYTLPKTGSVGVVGIWLSVPIGWFLADACGIIYYFARKIKGAK